MYEKQEGRSYPRHTRVYIKNLGAYKMELERVPVVDKPDVHMASANDHVIKEPGYVMVNNRKTNIGKQGKTRKNR